MSMNRHEPFLQSTPTQAIEAFFNDYPIKHYKKGHILILNSETVEHSYYLIEGKIKVYDVTYRGDEINITTFRPPAFFPVAHIINKSVTRYIYEAVTDIAIRRAPYGATMRFLGEHPDVVLNLLSYSYTALDNALERMVHVIASSAKDRLIYSLITECREYGELQPDGTYVLTISEKELGAKAGLSRETISREAQILKAAHLIEVRHTQIVILNLKKLEEYFNSTNP